jgi:hypothetical protein
MEPSIHWLLAVGTAAMLASSTLALNGQLELALLVGSVGLAEYAILQVLDRNDRLAPRPTA